MLALKTLLVMMSLATLASSSAIPIWELLTRQEKMGRLMYVFIHLVDEYCKESTIPDCQKVLTLYGLSHLVTEEEESLDLMDPYQRNGRLIIWHKVMRGSFKMPSKIFPEDSLADEDFELVNEVEGVPSPSSSPDYRKAFNDPHPYSVRVPAPAAHAAFSSRPHALRMATTRPLPLPPAGIKASADFEPAMSEGRTSSVSASIQRLLPDSSAPRPRRSRRAFHAFPEEEMKSLLSRTFGK